MVACATICYADLMELGLATFGDVHPGTTPERRMRELLEEIRLADQLGLDVFAIGEHHRPDYAVSAPAVVLGAGAAITERIRLSSAVSVLSSDDPVRVFQQFATVDLLSGGRAEIMAGRGSFTESFPLFGQDLKRLRRPLQREARLLLAIRERGARHAGPAAIARRSTARASTRGPSRTRCPCGSPSAARPSRSSAPGRSACR